MIKFEIEVRKLKTCQRRVRLYARPLLFVIVDWCQPYFVLPNTPKVIIIIIIIILLPEQGVEET